jgi:nucleoside phosphorylase
VVDLLIVTALTEEAQVVTAVLSHVAEKVMGDGDLQLYKYRSGTGHLYCVGAVSAHQMGAVGMGVFAAPLLKELCPTRAALIGIAAAVNAFEVSLGDVPFADQVVSYDDIVVQDGVLTFRSQGFQVESAMLTAAGKLHTSIETYQPWQDACQATIPTVVKTLNQLRRRQINPPQNTGGPHLLIGGVAGGPFLIRDKDFRDKLQKEPTELPAHTTICISAPLHPKLVSVEMESNGFMRAAHTHGVPAIVLKGISDNGDKLKANLENETGGYYRAYACSNATLAALHILQCCLTDKSPSHRKPSVSPLEELGTLADPNALDEGVRGFYLEAATKWADMVAVGSWPAWTQNLVQAMPRISVAQYDALHDASQWLTARYWPADGGKHLGDAFENFLAVLTDFIRVFDKHCESDQAGTSLRLQQFYKIHPFDFEQRQALLAEHEFYRDLIGDLVLELSRAANLVFRRIRDHVDPGFRLDIGEVIVSTPYRYDFSYEVVKPKYIAAEEILPRPYKMLDLFLLERAERDVSFGVGKDTSDPAFLRHQERRREADAEDV